MAPAWATRKTAASAIWWLGRIVAILLVGMVVAFAIGEGPPNPFHGSARENALTLAFLVVLVGFVVGCFRDGPGAILVIGGLLGFCLIQFAACGRFPGLGPLPFLAAPGVLFLTSFLLRRHERGSDDSLRPGD